MKELTILQGLTVHLSEDGSLPAQPDTAARSRRRGAEVEVQSATQEPVVSSLQDQALMLEGGCRSCPHWFRA